MIYFGSSSETIKPCLVRLSHAVWASAETPAWIMKQNRGACEIFTSLIQKITKFNCLTGCKCSKQVHLWDVFICCVRWWMCEVISRFLVCCEQTWIRLMKDPGCDSWRSECLGESSYLFFINSQSLQTCPVLSRRGQRSGRCSGQQLN